MEKATVRVDHKWLQALKAECERDGVAMTVVVEMLIRKYVGVKKDQRARARAQRRKCSI